MKTLAVTGGIGSGKSTVCRYFASKGIPVYDSDERTKRLYDADKALAGRLCEIFGYGICDDSGRVNRQKLASAVFSDPVGLEALEAVVHPAVKEDFLGWRDSCSVTDAPFVIMESAIILEKPFFSDVPDKILLVDAPLRCRMDRACRRDGVNKARIAQRMRNQILLNEISCGRAVTDADYIIINDSDEETLYRRSDAVYDAVCSAFRCL